MTLQGVAIAGQVLLVIGAVGMWWECRQARRRYERAAIARDVAAEELRRQTEAVAKRFMEANRQVEQATQAFEDCKMLGLQLAAVLRGGDAFRAQ